MPSGKPFDGFGRYYNDQRPHRALGRRTPAEAFAARPKAVPTGEPIDDAHFEELFPARNTNKFTFQRSGSFSRWQI